MDAPIYDSAKRQSPIVEELVEIVRYRDLVVQLVRRDIVTRYKRSVLGVAWAMLYPLGMMIVMTIAFSHVFHSTRAYAAYLLTGLVAWNFFAQATVAGTRQLVGNGDLFHRIYMPKTLWAISAVGMGLVNMLLSLIPLVAVMLVTGLTLRPSVFYLPISILVLAMFTLGVSLLLSTAAVFFRDMIDIYEIAVMAWFYLTPVLYPEQTIPESARVWLFTLNPMYHLLKLFRLPLYEGVWPSLTHLATAMAVAVIAFATGWIVFTRKSNELAYRI